MENKNKNNNNNNNSSNSLVFGRWPQTKINLAQLSSHEDDVSTWMVNEVPFLLFLALTKCLSIPHQGMARQGCSFFFFATFRKSQLSCLVPFPYHIRLEREINYLKIGSPFTNAAGGNRTQAASTATEIAFHFTSASPAGLL